MSIFGCNTAFPANSTRLDDPRLAQPGGTQEAQDELINLMTIMYVIIQEALSFPKELETTRSELRKNELTSRTIPRLISLQFL